VRILRILPQPLGELRQARAQLGDTLLELRDPRVLGSIPRFTGSERGFQLRDPLIPPVLRHGCMASPIGAQMESEIFYGAI
jgi:hypothetical protein